MSVNGIGERPRVFNATDVGSVEGPGSALGTFRAKGWGTAPLSELTLLEDGSFSAKLGGGRAASGRYTTRRRSPTR